MAHHRVLLLALAAVFSSTYAHAQAYKCKTASGQTMISDSPCRDGGRAVSVVQSEYISSEQRQQAAALHEQRRAEVKRIDAEYDARVAEQQRVAALNASANTANSKYKDAACQAASKPYPGSQGGLTKAQLQTLAACGGVNTPPRREVEYNDPYDNQPQAHANKHAASNHNQPPSQLIDARTGKVLPSIGGGNFIEPVSGTVMHGVGGGVINTRTGQFRPAH